MPRTEIHFGCTQKMRRSVPELQGVNNQSRILAAIN